MRISLPTLVATMLLLAGCDREPDPTVEVRDYGIYDAKVTTRGNWADQGPVEIQTIQDLKLKETTTRIPCRDKINFGWRCRITNSWDVPIAVSYSMSHPLISYPDGTSVEEERPNEMIVEPHSTAEADDIWYFLDSCPQEYLPGIWHFHLEIEGKTALQKDFEIYRPAP